MMNVMLAGDQRLSKSILWQIQRQFFLQNGVTAWQDDIVPHYISSNPFMARAYSQVVIGYLRDVATSQINANQPCENLLTLYSTQPEPDYADPTLWDRLELAYEAIPFQQPYYDNDDYNQILAHYEAILPDTTLLFPNVGLDCLKFWQGYDALAAMKFQLPHKLTQFLW